MNMDQLFRNLSAPNGKVDVVLDTDAYNEIDDQFAIGYMLKKTEKFNVRGICAAPFTNEKSSGPEDGMEKSYDEILKLLSLMETHSSSLAWRIPWTKEPGGLQSMGSQRVGHN